jgi:hypothetical protein
MSVTLAVIVTSMLITFMPIASAAGPRADVGSTPIFNRVIEPVRGDRLDRTEVGLAGDEGFFARLASFLACSHNWLEILASVVGYGDTPLVNVFAVAQTCHPGHGVYAIGRWIGSSGKPENRRTVEP